ncbi:hypothetical protein LSAT2_009899 [Lamellibrachia satsuma]|nr:hypothetical protein LSAT2_009899 [Lamellibrachia satsuma]
MSDDLAVLFSKQTLATFARIRDVFVLQVKAGANSYDNYAPTVDKKRVVFVFCFEEQNAAQYRLTFHLLDVGVCSGLRGFSRRGGCSEFVGERRQREVRSRRSGQKSTKWPAQTASWCEISEGKDEGTGDSTARGKAIATGWWTVGVFGETVEVSEPQALWRLLFLLQLGLWPVLLDLVWMLLQREQRLPSLRMAQWQVALV